jgi:Na+/phosphate symporter
MVAAFTQNPAWAPRRRVIAVVGATVNARRAAAAHALFNLMTGVDALVILP